MCVWHARKWSATIHFLKTLDLNTHLHLSIWHLFENLFVVGKFRSRKEKTSMCVTLNNVWVLRINIHFDSLNLFPDTDRSSINTIKTNWSISQISDFVNFLPLTFQLAPVQCWQHINQLSSSSSNTNIIITCFCAFHSCRMEKATQMIPER